MASSLFTVAALGKALDLPVVLRGGLSDVEVEVPGRGGSNQILEPHQSELVLVEDRGRGPVQVPHQVLLETGNSH